MAWGQCKTCARWDGGVIVDDEAGECYACRMTKRGKPVCSWCANTHIADVKCTCKEPCDAGFCPAGLEEEIRWL